MSKRTAPPGIYKGHQPYAPLRRRSGALVAGLAVPQDAADRFIEHCDTPDVFGCRVFVPRFKREGFKIAGVYHNPQQAAWRIWKTNAPPRVIRSTCDVERCVNPDHLIGSDWTCENGHPRVRDWSLITTRSGSECWICLICHHARHDEVCARGHDFTEHGVIKTDIRDGRRYRVCMECIRIKNRERYAANAAAVQATKRQWRINHPVEYQEELRRRRQRYVETRAARLAATAPDQEREAS
jgi:hypothetical protein